MYAVLLRKNETGEMLWCRQELAWSRHTFSWWTSGHMGCDCNRQWVWERAHGLEESDTPVCGEERFTLLAIGEVI